MSEAKTISVVMAASDFYAHTPELFQSLDAQTTDDFHVIVVDDGSLEGCELSSFDRAMVLRNMKRLGFGRALNQAISLSLARWEEEDLDKKYILIIQPEVILHEQTLATLATCLDERDDRVLAAPVMYRAIRTSSVEEELEIDFTDEMLYAGFEMTKSRELRFVNESDQLFGPPPECFMMRASFIKRLQEKEAFLDTSLQLFPALIDLLWRTKLLGGRMESVRDATVWKQQARTVGIRMRDEMKQERLVRFELHEVHVKLSPNLLRLRHAPWLLISWLKRFGEALTHPHLWVGYLRKPLLRFTVAKERADRFSKLGKRPVQMKDWFV